MQSTAAYFVWFRISFEVVTQCFVAPASHLLEFLLSEYGPTTQEKRSFANKEKTLKKATKQHKIILFNTSTR